MEKVNKNYRLPLKRLYGGMISENQGYTKKTSIIPLGHSNLGPLVSLPAFAECPVRKDRDECEKGTLRSSEGA
jgi:hypothetical protein